MKNRSTPISIPPEIIDMLAAIGTGSIAWVLSEGVRTIYIWEKKRPHHGVDEPKFTLIVKNMKGEYE